MGRLAGGCGALALDCFSPWAALRNLSLPCPYVQTHILPAPHTRAPSRTRSCTGNSSHHWKLGQQFLKNAGNCVLAWVWSALWHGCHQYQEAARSWHMLKQDMDSEREGTTTREDKALSLLRSSACQIQQPPTPPSGQMRGKKKKNNRDLCLKQLHSASVLHQP